MRTSGEASSRDLQCFGEPTCWPKHIFLAYIPPSASQLQGNQLRPRRSVAALKLPNRRPANSSPINHGSLKVLHLLSVMNRPSPIPDHAGTETMIQFPAFCSDSMHFPDLPSCCWPIFGWCLRWYHKLSNPRLPEKFWRLPRRRESVSSFRAVADDGIRTQWRAWTLWDDIYGVSPRK